MGFRFFFTLTMFCLLPLIPWWVLVPIVGLVMVLIPNYWESLAIFFLYDLAFGMPSGWLGTQFTFTIVFSVAYLLVEGVRDSFIFSRN